MAKLGPCVSNQVILWKQGQLCPGSIRNSKFSPKYITNFKVGPVHKIQFKVRIERNKAVEETRDARRAADRLEADRDRLR